MYRQVCSVERRSKQLGGHGGGTDLEECCSLPPCQDTPEKSGLRLFVAGATASSLSLVSYATAANDDDSGTVADLEAVSVSPTRPNPLVLIATLHSIPRYQHFSARTGGSETHPGTPTMP